MVSALIHAATLVCLGCVWISKLVVLTGLPLAVVGICSCGLLSYSVVSVLQSDSKRLIAYSTGYNIAGIVAWLTLQVELALHHMGAHAMFKAALFLAAGAAIHACSTQDQRTANATCNQFCIGISVALLLYFSAGWF